MTTLFGAHAPYVWSALAAVVLGVALELWSLRHAERTLERAP